MERDEILRSTSCMIKAVTNNGKECEIKEWNARRGNKLSV